MTRTVWILWAAVMLLLAMACVNVANLLMAKATTRQHEVTVRVALGASRARILRQLLTESLPLSLAGGALGVLLAWLGVELLRRLGTDYVPRIDEIAIDWHVLVFAALAAAGSAVVFGLAPLVQLSSSELRPAIGSGGRTTSGRTRRRTIEGLVALQMAMALVLLVGAGLMMKSFFALTRVNPGFRTSHILEVGVALSPTQYKADQMIQVYKTIDRELSSLPGVDAVGAISIAPESGNDTYTRFVASDWPLNEDEFLMAHWRSPTPGYFRALAIPLVRGRLMEEADFSLDRRNAIVNQTAAKRWWPDADPIGKTVTPSARKDLHYTVVGVVGDVLDVTLNAEPDAMVYLLGRNWPAMTFLVHTAGEPTALAGAARERLRQVNPNIPDDARHARPHAGDVGGAAALRQHDAGDLLVGGVDAGDDGHLQRHLVLGGAADARNRHPHGARRAAARRLAHGARARRRADGDRNRGRARRRVRLHARARQPALQRRAIDAGVYAAVTLLLALVALGATYLAARKATRVEPSVALRYD